MLDFFDSRPWRSRAALAGVLLAAVATFAAPIAAQSFPDRPIRIVVPFPPGGSSDVVARLVADGATEALGQSVIVENVGGAGGNIGTARVAKAAADGYTLIQCTIGTCAINGLLSANTGFDVQKDFVPVFFTGGVMNVITVNLAFPARSVAELIDWAKANPGKLSFGSSGIGSSNHLTPEWLKTITATDMVHVPYRGSGPAIADLLAGSIAMFVDNEPSILPQIKAGRIRALAVTGERRSAALPDIPTMEELGYKGFVVEPWFGFMAPRGTPRAVIDRLNAGFNTAVANPRVRKRLDDAGLRVSGGPPERLADQIRLESARWAVVVKANNIRAD